jgi:hypothetical protein
LLLLEGAINPITDICNELMRFHKGVFPKDVLVYFRDIAVHTKRIDRTIHGMREMLNEFQAHAGAGLAISYPMVVVGVALASLLLYFRKKNDFICPDFYHLPNFVRPI